MCSMLSLDFTSEDDLTEWCIALTFVFRFLVFIAVLVLLVVVVFVILKYLRDFEDERATEGVTATETDGLRPSKAILITYGTSDQEDLESGNCSSSKYSSEELYDGKICIICYDEQRNCFFVPCGHCATCYCCAQRIFNGDNKTCPVCRRLIRKVRKLFAP